MTDETSSPQLFWADDGSPRSGRFGDVYFSSDDGLSETRAVFLAGCGMPDIWQGRERFTVAELGFGTGLNIIALIELWRTHRPDGAQLQVFTVEGFPLTRDEAARALAAWPQVADTATALLDQWPTRRPGFHRIDLPHWGVTIDIAIGEVQWALSQWHGQADAWFLDGFSPALNPGMWSDEILASVAAHSAPAARLATFTVAGAVRRALAANGYTVEKKPGHGRKRERLEARMGGLHTPGDCPAVAVIGGGIAGASTIRALKAQGLRAVLVEADTPGAGGSGFPASLVTPRLDVGDTIISGLYAQCLERAGQLYGAVQDAIVSRGVLQLEQAARDANRFDRIASQPLWAPGAMQRLDSTGASALLEESVQKGGLLMHDAFVLEPARVLSAWLEGTPVLQARVEYLEKADDQNGQGGWLLLDRNRTVITRADHVVVAAGWGTDALLPRLALSPVAGQADWARSDALSSFRPVAWGGYSVPTRAGLLFGATHDRGVTRPVPSDEASARNTATLTDTLPTRASAIAAAPMHRRTAVRATTPDRLPFCGTLEQGLHVIAGMGSRGFCAAPLLGEHLAAVIAGSASPLPREFSQRLHPDRVSKASA